MSGDEFTCFNCGEILPYEDGLVVEGDGLACKNCYVELSKEAS